MGIFNALVSGTFLSFSRRRSNRETDYETVLSRLETEIQTVQSRLTQIRLRERRASVTLTLQAFLLWAIYTFACWFFGLLSLQRPHHLDVGGGAGKKGWAGTRTYLVWTPVLGSPVLIISTRRIVRWWYRRIGAAEEKHLIDLRRQKREKIDEIKKATKYDHLRMLLDKYDEASPVKAELSTPMKGKPNSKNVTPTKSPNNASPQQQQPQHQQQQQQQRIAGSATPETAANLQAQKMASMRQQPPTASIPVLRMQKTWTDKLADAILGSDPSVVGPEQKYALICNRCLRHNGLALKEEFNEVQYVCPHCGNFNSRRPSSAPVSSPFNNNTGSSVGGGVLETPSKPGKKASGGSKLKLSTDASSDEEAEDEPPKTTLQEEQQTGKMHESPRDAKSNSLPPSKSASGKTERMDLHDD
ncbi:hypothetical protein NDA11_004768 [Ustilago hordei]|uniref:Endoplasmic reticulum junction formation protein lunapark n=1 Tax=Ustilago hordei TaxID=120017 RepID=I2FMW3_USTHO|nr:uncharacterized protein UHO2_04780 [Ustilago hordei]KAJ1041835.1 hypothetical protein NDA10_001256 [Ustilago hordei]KAJ1575557.1 hypothetical protein NDA15_006052 [Ustilago hordei]KAJ1577281.1 hypothetical protein NDA12_004582 [Ustilago hordei]KAJ1595192.1 hypothetical protein NDA11_004768 [Ustilago hordei]KAJ1596906.1 hypothetical protein NDA14_000188 [Ustilago hordei]